MDYNLHISYPIEDRSFLSLIKAEIKKLSDEVGLTTEETGKLNIIVTELLTNLVKFGQKDREILVKPIIKNNYPGIELISIDKGPGAKEPGKMMEDGYSTSGTKGEGLGAIKRLSDEFDIYTHSTGTIVLSRVYKKKINIYDKPKDKFDFAGIMVAKKGEHVCGDQWYVDEKDDECRILVVDGLGHGPEANHAAVLAVETFKSQSKFDSPEESIDQIHNHIKKTRGAVGLAVKINNAKKTMSHCGVGNISCRIVNTVNYENNKSLILFNGILGLNVKRMNNSISSWDNNKTIIIHSDGLNTRWDLNNYPGILNHHPAIIAAVLYRDNNRKTDDITVLVGRTKTRISYDADSKSKN